MVAVGRVVHVVAVLHRAGFVSAELIRVDVSSADVLAELRADR